MIVMPGVPPTSIVEIAAGRFELGIAPELGGSVAYLRWRDGDRRLDLLRPLSDADRVSGDVLGVAMFPMVPYANCIEDNAFDFDGQRYEVEPNLPPYKFNFHGSGWLLPWSVRDRSSTHLILSLVDDAPDRPHRYSALQRFDLENDRLVVTTEVANLGPRRMPFGFGQHPWFPRRGETHIAFNARRFWLESVDSGATEPISVPPELDFATPRRPPPVRRNNCYEAWSGLAEIFWRDDRVGLRMAADRIFRHLMVYFPAPPASVFCLEPQTNLVSAFTRADPGRAGVIVLDPGQSVTGAITFTPFTT